MIIQYHSHIETIVNYIQHYLNVFNIVKKTLRFFQKKRFFDIFKMHNLIYCYDTDVCNVKKMNSLTRRNC